MVVVVRVGMVSQAAASACGGCRLGKIPGSAARGGCRLGKKPGSAARDECRPGKIPGSIARDECRPGKIPGSIARDGCRLSKKPGSIARGGCRLSKIPGSIACGGGHPSEPGPGVLYRELCLRSASPASVCGRRCARFHRTGKAAILSRPIAIPRIGTARSARGTAVPAVGPAGILPDAAAHEAGGTPAGPTGRMPVPLCSAGIDFASFASFAVHPLRDFG